MRSLLVLAACAAALSTAACVTVIDADGHDVAWHGQGAETFDSARAACRAQTGDRRSDAFMRCMADKGWTRTEH